MLAAVAVVRRYRKYCHNITGKNYCSLSLSPVKMKVGLPAADLPTSVETELALMGGGGFDSHRLALMAVRRMSGPLLLPVAQLAGSMDWFGPADSGLVLLAGVDTGADQPPPSEPPPPPFSPPDDCDMVREDGGAFQLFTCSPPLLLQQQQIIQLRLG